MWLNTLMGAHTESLLQFPDSLGSSTYEDLGDLFQNPFLCGLLVFCDV